MQRGNRCLTEQDTYLDVAFLFYFANARCNDVLAQIHMTSRERIETITKAAFPFHGNYILTKGWWRQCTVLASLLCKRWRYWGRCMYSHTRPHDIEINKLSHALIKYHLPQPLASASSRRRQLNALYRVVVSALSF